MRRSRRACVARSRGEDSETPPAVPLHDTIGPKCLEPCPSASDDIDHRYLGEGGMGVVYGRSTRPERRCPEVILTRSPPTLFSASVSGARPGWPHRQPSHICQRTNWRVRRTAVHRMNSSMGITRSPPARGAMPPPTLWRLASRFSPLPDFHRRGITPGISNRPIFLTPHGRRSLDFGNTRCSKRRRASRAILPTPYAAGDAQVHGPVTTPRAVVDASATLRHRRIARMLSGTAAFEADTLPRDGKYCTATWRSLAVRAA